MFLRIEAPHFVAGYDMDSGEVAPIIKYMKGWTFIEVLAYCKKKHWKLYAEKARTSTKEES